MFCHFILSLTVFRVCSRKAFPQHDNISTVSHSEGEDVKSHTYITAFRHIMKFWAHLIGEPFWFRIIDLLKGITAKSA